MKNLLLLFTILYAGVLQAQYMPNLLQPYSNPKDLNNKMDSTYLPGSNYKVEIYNYNGTILQWDLTQYYLVETDDYLLTKAQFYTMASGSVYEYTSHYSGNLLVAKSTAQKDISGNMVIQDIDSFQYSGQNLSTRIRWRNDGSTYTQGSGTNYFYDYLSRFLGTDGFNLYPNVVYLGYFSVNDQNAQGRPTIVTDFSMQLTEKTIGGQHFFQYDQLGRPKGYKATFLDNGSFMEYDSCKNYYSDQRNYPDSSLYFNLRNNNSLYRKLVYTYTSQGKISEITTYTIDFDGIHPYRKEVYSAIGTSGLNAINSSPSADISIYPNPCNNGINISAGSHELLSYRIYDLQGRVCKDGGLNPTAHDVSTESLQNGLYLLQVTFENGHTAYKYFIKEN